MIGKPVARRNLLKLAGIGAVGTVATACAPAATPAPAKPAATAAPAAPAKAVTTLDWWTVASADVGTQPQQEGLIAEFNKLSNQTGASVKATFLPDDGFSEKMIESFLRPWLGGIFLETELSTSSRRLEFVFRFFAGDIFRPPALASGAF